MRWRARIRADARGYAPTHADMRRHTRTYADTRAGGASGGYALTHADTHADTRAGGASGGYAQTHAGAEGTPFGPRAPEAPLADMRGWMHSKGHALRQNEAMHHLWRIAEYVEFGTLFARWP